MADDEIYTAWNKHESEHVEPQHREAIVMPRLVLEALDLPEELFEPVARVWDEAFKTAIHCTEHVARHLQNPGQQ